MGFINIYFSFVLLYGREINWNKYMFVYLYIVYIFRNIVFMLIFGIDKEGL